MISFFEQCQATDKAAGVLEKIAKDKQPKEWKTAQLPVTRSRELSYPPPPKNVDRHISEYVDRLRCIR